MDLFDKALCFATERHKGQVRKNGNIPYILHPIEVATIVATMSDDEDLLCAALLHDTVEDTNTTLEELTENFGKRVSLLVLTETENKRENLPPNATWQIRKEETLIMLEHTRDLDVKKLWLGDKLANMRSIARDYMVMGDDVWLAFNQKDPKKQIWYYATIARCLYDLHNYAAYKEYIALVKFVFEKHLGEYKNEINSYQ